MKLLTLARDLGRRRSRERHRLFLAEGIRVVEELLHSGLSIRGALAGPELTRTPRGAALRDRLHTRGVEVLELSERDFASVAQTDSPQGVVAIASAPTWNASNLARADDARIVVLDAVQDPGNVGTILRTAAALGATATVALPGTVDLWNAKVVRSAMGAHFHHPSLHCSLDELAGFLHDADVPLWGADAHGTPVGELRPPPRRLALAVGNEGAGLTPALRARATVTVSLPIAGAVESLNVAVATGILLYELRR